MSGVVVVAGIFPPGSTVAAFRVPNERVLRPEGHPELGRRVVDANGDVGWEGLTVGDRVLIEGLINGKPIILRRTATDSERPAVQQRPIGQTPQTTGTQQAKVEDPPPAPLDVETGVGVPAAANASLPIGPDQEAGQSTYETGGLAAKASAPSNVTLERPGPVPSESAGVREGAGAPSEQQTSPEPSPPAGGDGGSADGSPPPDQPPADGGTTTPVP